MMTTNQPILLSDVEDEVLSKDIYKDLSQFSVSSIKPIESVDTFLEFVIPGLFITSVGTLGLIGNMMAIYVLSRPQMRTSTNYILIGLATSDSILLMTSILMLGMPAFHVYSSRQTDSILSIFYWKIFPYITVVVYPVGMIAQSSSTYLTLGVTLERYVAVCRPLKARSICTLGRAKSGVILVAVSAILYNIPRFLEVHVVNVCEPTSNAISSHQTSTHTLINNVTEGGVEVQRNFAMFNFSEQMMTPSSDLNLVKEEMCWTDVISVMDVVPPPNIDINEKDNGKYVNSTHIDTSTENEKVEKKMIEKRHLGWIRSEVRATTLRTNQTYISVYITWMYLVVMYLVPFTTLALFNTVIYWNVRRANKARNNLSQTQQREMGIATMLMIVVLIFVACNILALIINLLELFAIDISDVTQISNLLVTLNSSCNIIIYSIWGKKFKVVFQRVIIHPILQSFIFKLFCNEWANKTCSTHFDKMPNAPTSAFNPSGYCSSMNHHTTRNHPHISSASSGNAASSTHNLRSSTSGGQRMVVRNSFCDLLPIVFKEGEVGGGERKNNSSRDVSSHGDVLTVPSERDINTFIMQRRRQVSVTRPINDEAGSCEVGVENTCQPTHVIVEEVKNHSDETDIIIGFNDGECNEDDQLSSNNNDNFEKMVSTRFSDTHLDEKMVEERATTDAAAEHHDSKMFKYDIICPTAIADNEFI